MTVLRISLGVKATYLQRGHPVAWVVTSLTLFRDGDGSSLGSDQVMRLLDSRGLHSLAVNSFKQAMAATSNIPWDYNLQLF
jgi:hypothetical protein